MIELDKLYCIDCVEGMKLIEDNFIDFILTSPPYDNLRDYNGFNFDFENIAIQMYRIIKKGGVIVWVVGDKVNNGNKSLTSFKQALFFQDIGFNVHDIMIYKKLNTPFMRSNAYTNCFEFMFILSKGSPKTFHPIKTKTKRYGKEMLVAGKKSDGINNKVLGELKKEKTLTNIWEYAVGLGGSTKDRFAFKHPAIFPEKLAQDHILSWTNEKDIVLDPMCGSGTTCKMAKLSNRHFIGFDISKEYISISQNRINILSV
ncbi:MAG: site-specific DNA-methyltransferase [Bacteroidales bacterium]|nr:site-specific DNA-methyltransferase [Bacteroidales bacterium]